MDLNKYVDGIDIESISYKYCNSLNQFKEDLRVEIKIQNEIGSRTKTISLHEMLKSL